MEPPLPRLQFLRDDSPIQIRNLGLFGIRPGLPTLLKKIEGFFDPWSQNVNRLEGSNHPSPHKDQVALLLGDRPGFAFRRGRDENLEPSPFQRGTDVGRIHRFSGRKYHVIFDMVPGSHYRACIKALNPNGRYLSGNPRFSVMLRSVITTRFTDKTARFAFARESKEELAALKEMIEDGTIGSIVDRVFPMEQAAVAHRLVETEQRLGAVVIAIGDLR